MVNSSSNFTTNIKIRRLPLNDDENIIDHRLGAENAAEETAENATETNKTQYL